MDNEQTVWSPQLSQKQADLVNCQKRYILAHGPRLTGKTIGCCHKICRHLWHNDGSRVLMFAKTVKTAAIAGTYKTLIDVVLPEWFEGGFGMHYTVEPKVDGATRTHHFKVSNYYGSESELYLFSIEHDKEIEEKTKNLVASMVYFIELSNFKDRIAFDATIAQLRLPNVPYDSRCWLGDTNPDDDGRDSWIYKLWFDKDLGEGAALLPANDRNELLDNLHEMLFVPADNPFLDPREFAALRASYAHSLDLTNRYINGLWIPKTEGGHFEDVFNLEEHVIGNVNVPDDEKEVLLPTEACSELITGFDPGDRYMSFHVLEKVFTTMGSVYCVLDELYSDGDMIGLSEFATLMTEKIQFWEDFIMNRHNRKISWRHWADKAATTHYKSAAGAFDSNVVLRATGGKIALMGAPKGTGSVKRRVDIMRMLLHEGRLFVSAACPGTIEMLKRCRKGKSQVQYVAKDKFRHRFDSLTYILDAEEPVDVQRRMTPQSQGKLVFVNA